MKIGLFFGSFNPFHIGHLIIANHILEYTNIKNIWFVLSPKNSFKKQLNLLKKRDRLIMIQLAIKNYKNMKVCDIEFYLSNPYYTINTINVLKKKYPKECFRLIIGEDLVKNFFKWKESNILIKYYKPYIYPRLSFQFENKNPKMYYLKAPIIGISSSFIRSCIKENKNVRPLLPSTVWKYLIKNNLYKIFF